MSSTPPNPPVGRPSPAGPNFVRRRRPKPADPLVRPKKRPIPRPPTTQGQAPASSANGRPHPPPQPVKPQASAASKPIPSADDLTANGFSGPLLSQNCIDYPLITTKRAWREGLRHHVAKFVTKKSVDPRDESQFTRPVRMQRRDPRASANTQAINEGEGNDHKGNREQGNGTNEADREQLEEKKAARAKEREENLAQIAPAISATGPKRMQAPKQRTQQVFKSEMTPAEIARARVKYEEALPWHMEDFDSKNTWVGKYEAAMSDTYAMFVLEPSGKMRMVPIDKWYKLSAKNQFKALTIEEAEKHMARKIRDPRWFMEKEQARAQEKELQKYAKQSKMFTGRSQTSTIREGLEGDDMDFEEDRFADDEEHVGLFDEDEDAKTAEERIKKDQLKANIFDLKEEKIYDEEESKEKKEKEELKSFGKQVRKALQRREKNFDYSSGSDANPYSEEESTDESEVERQKEEQRKAEEELKAKEKDSEKPSGASTKGTNTPSERPKHTDSSKKTTSQLPVRKRPGSPNISDASGTDTSRKRPKNKHATTAPSALSPGAQAQRKSLNTTGSVDGSKAGAKKRGRNGPSRAGSTSDGEVGAGSGAEISDNTVSKKLKLNPPGVKSRTATPAGSRAASPAPSGRAVTGSRASSPDSGRGNQTRTSTPGTGSGSGPLPAFPTSAEIHSAIPSTGILSNDLLRLFRSRLGDSRENHRKFIAIVKDVSVFGKEDKLLRPGVLRES